MVVAEGGRHCVSVFSPSGEKLRSFGSCGSGEGQFDCPIGVAVDTDGNILVADLNNHRIQKFTSGGQFLTAVGTWGDRPLQFKFPNAIAWNAFENKVYVVDNDNYRILVLNRKLTTSSIFQKLKRCISISHFHSPRGIACDSTGKVYLVMSGCVEVFTANGVSVRVIGRHGRGRGELAGPKGVTIDTSCDMVYVSEWDNHRVSVFTSEGQFVTTFVLEEAPEGLAVDSSGVFACVQSQ